MSARASIGDDTSDGSPRTRQQPGAACDECRRRKLRCDRKKPQCGSCQASGVACIVPATKPARGPKRGHLKTLQARIAALEGALREQQYILPTAPEAQDAPISLDMTDMDLNQVPWDLGISGENDLLPGSRHISYYEKDPLSTLDIETGGFSLPNGPIDNDASILTPAKLNMARPYPIVLSSPQSPSNAYESSEGSPDVAMSSVVQSDLYQLYIDRIHMFVPIVHHGRCATWSRCEPDSMSEAQMTLQHAMWTLAASTSAYHLTLRDSFYHRTRQALESLDQRSNATETVDTENVQAWLLLAIHELMCVGFRRAWISAGRAFRLIQLDPAWITAAGPVADNDTPPPADRAHLVEAEQRRRTFWFAYCLDRFISLRNGSSPAFSERVSVRLPCPEPAFQYGQPVPMGFLLDANAMASTTAFAQGPMSPTSPFGECIVVATVAGHVLSHRLQAAVDTATAGDRQDTHTYDDFWDRHARLDSLVTHSMGGFTRHYPPAAQERDPMLLFLAIMWRATVLYLWHTAESIPAPVQGRNRAVSAESSQQVEKAAREMLRLMSKLSELNSWKVHPLMTVPLTLCAELLAPRPDLMEEFSQRLKEITEATHGLRLFSNAEPRPQA
ncbi:hypothetical protein F5B20DRAFT_589247 [Whalleya microplaca]|nr:hypothetical protein F5B20DRAFT_589247 [Whalleya microplaca]